MSQRVQLNLLACSPFGEYQIDLDVESFSDENSTLQQRTSWQIKNGPDEVLTGEHNNAWSYPGLMPDDNMVGVTSLKRTQKQI